VKHIGDTQDISISRKGGRVISGRAVLPPFPWMSRLGQHLQCENDILVKVGPLAAIVHNWQELLQTDLTEEEQKAIHGHELTGRPLGNENFLTRPEKNN